MKPFSFPRISLPIVLIVFCLAFLGTNRAFAQQATAQLDGNRQAIPPARWSPPRRSPSGHTGTNIAHSITTNKGGDYLFTLVPIGAYELHGPAAGF